MEDVTKEPKKVVEQEIKPLPLTADDLRGESLTAVARSTLQFQADVINVMEGRVKIDTFSPDHQRKIKNYYRFAPVSIGSPAGEIATKGAQRVGKG